jgi:hypothetical protein
MPWPPSATTWCCSAIRCCGRRRQLWSKSCSPPSDLRLPQALAKLDRYVCVFLDDIGYVQHDRDEMEVLFTFLSERYEHRSVAISTNLVFSEWNRIFKDPMTTMAAIDRVVHHSVILDLMTMDSYRAKEASGERARRAQPAPTTSDQMATT